MTTAMPRDIDDPEWWGSLPVPWSSPGPSERQAESAMDGVSKDTFQQFEKRFEEAISGLMREMKSGFGLLADRADTANHRTSKNEQAVAQMAVAMAQLRGEIGSVDATVTEINEKGCASRPCDRAALPPPPRKVHLDLKDRRVQFGVGVTTTALAYAGFSVLKALFDLLHHFVDKLPK